jgi:hypothetical protein
MNALQKKKEKKRSRPPFGYFCLMIYNNSYVEENDTHESKNAIKYCGGYFWIYTLFYVSMV